MDAYLLWLEKTSFSVWMRESPSLLAFPAILSAHTVGMGLVAGINGAFALRILGVGAGIPVKELKRFVPFMWFGFWLNFVSGVALLIAYPTKAVTNPVFYLKLSFIAAAMVLFMAINRRLFRTPVSHNPAGSGSVTRLAAASLVCWTGAITAGRLLAYTYTRLLADF